MINRVESFFQIYKYYPVNETVINVDRPTVSSLKQGSKCAVK